MGITKDEIRQIILEEYSILVEAKLSEEVRENYIRAVEYAMQQGQDNLKPKIDDETLENILAFLKKPDAEFNEKYSKNKELVRTLNGWTRQIANFKHQKYFTFMQRLMSHATKINDQILRVSEKILDHYEGPDRYDGLTDVQKEGLDSLITKVSDKIDSYKTEAANKAKQEKGAEAEAKAKTDIAEILAVFRTFQKVLTGSNVLDAEKNDDDKAEALLDYGKKMTSLAKQDLKDSLEILKIEKNRAKLDAPNKERVERYYDLVMDNIINPKEAPTDDKMIAAFKSKLDDPQTPEKTKQAIRRILRDRYNQTDIQGDFGDIDPYRKAGQFGKKILVDAGIEAKDMNKPENKVWSFLLDTLYDEIKKVERLQEGWFGFGNKKISKEVRTKIIENPTIQAILGELGLSAPQLEMLKLNFAKRIKQKFKGKSLNKIKAFLSQPKNEGIKNAFLAAIGKSAQNVN